MMKKTIVTIVCLAFYLNNFAQENIVKVGLFGLVTKSLNLKYERVLNKKNSVNLNLQFKIPGGLPFGFTLNDIADGSISTTDELKIKGFSISPEYRIYTKENAPRGFYLAPYIQLKNYTAQFSGEVDGYYRDIKASYGNIGAGVQMGAQWLIKDRVSIDWYFFGLGVNRNTVKLTLTSDDPNIDFEQYERDAEESLRDVPFLENRIEPSSGDNYGEIKANLIFPATRAGLSFGVTF